MILDDSSDSKIIFREILCSLNTEVGRIKVLIELANKLRRSMH